MYRPSDYQLFAAEVNGNYRSRNLYANNGVDTPVAPEGGRPVAPGPNNIPETPIAPEGGRPVAPGPNNIPETPIAPEGGRPVAPGPDNIPETPIAPEGGRPVAPGPDNIPETPIAPEGGRPVAPGPVLPPTNQNGGGIIRPIPGIRPQDYAQVRVLNALVDTMAINVTIDTFPYVSNLRNGSISNYGRVGDGFHNVLITNANNSRRILYSAYLPFTGGQKVTLAVVETRNGIEVVSVNDRACKNTNRQMGCLRVANMSYENSAFDVYLYGGELVFRDVRFKEITPFKQAMAGEYQFYVTNAVRNRVIAEIPIIIISNFIPPQSRPEPLTSFAVDVEAGSMYTIYLLGTSQADTNMNVIVVKD